MENLEQTRRQRLKEAVRSGSAEIVCRLLKTEKECWEDINFRNLLLAEAIERGQCATVELLIQRDFTANGCHQEEHHLHRAVRRSRSDVIKVLVRCGADVNAQNEVTGKTALHLTAASIVGASCEDVLNLLLAEDVNSGNDAHERQSNDCRNINEMYFDSPISLNGSRKNLSSNKDKDLVYFDCNSSHSFNNINNIPNDKKMRDDIGCVRYKDKTCHRSDNYRKSNFLESKDKIQGNTALHVACAYNNADAALCLLRHGANPNPLNDYGDTPLAKLLQPVTRKGGDSHNRSRLTLARRLVALGLVVSCGDGAVAKRRNPSTDNGDRECSGGDNRCSGNGNVILENNLCAGIQKLDIESSYRIGNRIIDGEYSACFRSGKTCQLKVHVENDKNDNRIFHCITSVEESNVVKEKDGRGCDWISDGSGPSALASIQPGVQSKYRDIKLAKGQIGQGYEGKITSLRKILPEGIMANSNQSKNVTSGWGVSTHDTAIVARNVGNGSCDRKTVALSLGSSKSRSAPLSREESEAQLAALCDFPSNETMVAEARSPSIFQTIDSPAFGKRFELKQGSSSRQDSNPKFARQPCSQTRSQQSREVKAGSGPVIKSATSEAGDCVKQSFRKDSTSRGYGCLVSSRCTNGTGAADHALNVGGRLGQNISAGSMRSLGSCVNIVNADISNSFQETNYRTGQGSSSPARITELKSERGSRTANLAGPEKVVTENMQKLTQSHALGDQTLPNNSISDLSCRPLTFRYPSREDRIRLRFQRLLGEISVTLTLRQLCRLAILKSLVGKNVSTSIEQLGLPLLMRRFLLSDDLF
ncbi:ankyrin repeat protein [Plakobranchus ocellatus]|uniref:Ankyrin repeat protein n=1 Tax=Plakobranchus ocellatus TaxID=259542 RepID=A0AAV3Y478_9GAST|nr:ankyrin repeat protein [Plakobranchus ocellatus]